MNQKINDVRDRLIVALDVPTVWDAYRLVSTLGDGVSFYKIGYRLAFAGGLDLARQLVAEGKKVFLDLKLHDIPATVRLAVRQFAGRGITFATVHGYPPVVEAALAADTGVGILAVTVLTSLGPGQAAELGCTLPVADLVLQRAEGALRLGCRGVVCSAGEAQLLRSRLGQDFAMVTPGIRPAGSDPGDQQRIATPGRAIADGADYLVIGRPIRDAADPAAQIAAIQKEIEAALDR